MSKRVKPTKKIYEVLGSGTLKKGFPQSSKAQFSVTVIASSKEEAKRLAQLHILSKEGTEMTVLDIEEITGDQLEDLLLEVPELYINLGARKSRAEGYRVYPIYNNPNSEATN